MNFKIIDQKRRDKNLTISELCRQANINRKTYYKALENPAGVRFSTADKLAKTLKLNAAEKSQIFN
jgi:DNA-binding phage protein